jgi:NTE family protein
VNGKAVWSTQTLFANYTASLLSSPSFDLIPDSKTFFLPEFRSPQFMGVGLNFIFSISSKFDLRFDSYMYQPILMLSKLENVSYVYAEPIKDAEILSSASFIFHSLVGPIRATLNYFPKQKEPFSFQVSYGYIIFNNRAIR